MSSVHRAVLRVLAIRGPLSAAEIAEDPTVNRCDGRDLSHALSWLRLSLLLYVHARRRGRYVWALTTDGEVEAAKPDPPAPPPTPRFTDAEMAALRALRGGRRAAKAHDWQTRRCCMWATIRGGTLDARAMRSLVRQRLVVEVARRSDWTEYALTPEGERAAEVNACAI